MMPGTKRTAIEDFFSKPKAEVRAEAQEPVACDCKHVMHECDERPGCRVLKSLSAPQPAAFPSLPAGVVQHPHLGELYDRLQVQQYAMKYAMLHASPQPPAKQGAHEPYAHEYGRSDGGGWYSVVIERGIPRDPCKDWPVKPLYATPQPPAPCPNCCGQEPDDLHLRDEYMKAEREIKRLQAKVDEQILRCPVCEGRANGDSVLVPSAELKKLQATIAQQAEQLANAKSAIKDAESLHRIDRNAYVGESAQQAGRIAALETDNKAAWATADRHLKERNGAIERIAELEKQCEDQCISCKWPCGHKDQAALIEQCKDSLEYYADEGFIGVPAREAIAAIAVHRGQHSELAAQCSESLPQCSELERDAARYKWLVGEHSRSILESFMSVYGVKGFESEVSALNSAIDAAIAKDAP